MSTLVQEPKSTTSKESVSANSNFIGAAGQCAVAIGTSLNNFYKFLRQYALQKAAETKNTLTAAQSQASSIIDAGKKQMIGAIFSGGAEIAAGIVGVAGSFYDGYQAGKKSANLSDLNAKAPQQLNEFRAQTRVANNPFDGEPISEADFNKLLKDPRVFENDPAFRNRIAGKTINTDQEERFNSSLKKFGKEKAPLQKELQGELKNLGSNIQHAEQMFGFLARGLGSLGKGVYDAKAAADNAAATLAEATRSMAGSALDATSQAASLLMSIIEGLRQTQTALANANRGS